MISSKDYTEADGDEITELQVVFSSGSESALAEHGLDEGTITDFAKVGSDGLTHFLNVSTYRGYSDTDDGPVLTHTRDNQSVLSATYDFSGSIDEGGSPFDVLLGLTGDPAGEGENEIDFKSTAHEVIENLPDLPGVRMEDTYTVTIDATVTVTVDESGISGTVSGTKTSIGLTVVEGIFHSGVSMDPDGNQTGRWDNLPVGTTHYGDGTVSLDDTFGVTVRSKEQILADLREAVATKLRIEAIMAHDPDVGANLASQLTDIETSIADLDAAAAEAGATPEEIAAAKSVGAADAAGFNPFLYVMRVYLLRGEGIGADPPSILTSFVQAFPSSVADAFTDGPSWDSFQGAFTQMGDVMLFGMTDFSGWMEPLYGNNEAHSQGEIVGTVWGTANWLAIGGYGLAGGGVVLLRKSTGGYLLRVLKLRNGGGALEVLNLRNILRIEAHAIRRWWPQWVKYPHFHIDFLGRSVAKWHFPIVEPSLVAWWLIDE